MFRSYAFFRQIFQETARDYPGVATDFAYVDAMTTNIVKTPERYDVVVLENMFGDILSELGAATVGGLGMVPSGDMGERFGLFEPGHGSAPEAAGRGLANPVAAILAAAMMCRWLGLQNADPDAEPRRRPDRERPWPRRSPIAGRAPGTSAAPRRRARPPTP